MSASKILKLSKPVSAMRQVGAKAYYVPSALFSSNTNIPDNMQEINDSQKSQCPADRSREVSDQQTSRMFSGAFMSSQAQQEELSSDSGIDQSVGGDNCYDLDGHAHMSMETNVPEPYRAENESDLKEGVPEGLSDCVKGQAQRWSMEDRIDHSYEIKS